MWGVNALGCCDAGRRQGGVVRAESDDSNGPVSIIGVGESPSDGLRKGVVVNLDKTIASIQAAAVAAERMAGRRIESVVVSSGGIHLRAQEAVDDASAPGGARATGSHGAQRGARGLCCGSQATRGRPTSPRA